MLQSKKDARADEIASVEAELAVGLEGIRKLASSTKKQRTN